MCIYVLTISLIFIWVLRLQNTSILGIITIKIKNLFKLGFILFIISEVLFFASFFWRFFFYSLRLEVETVVEWPPTGLLPIDRLGVPLLNTVILLSSGITVTWAHSSVETQHPIKTPLVSTVCLGLIFVGVQLVEYLTAPFSFCDSVYGSCFFLLTGFHGIHVSLGCAMLRFWIYYFVFNSPLSITGFECSSWYWHFVDVVWLFLFCFVYLWAET